MVRKLSLVLPAIFVLVFAFCLVVSMQSSVVAGPPDCCHIVNNCDGVLFHGECPRIDGVCQCNLVVNYCDPPPQACEPQ